MDIAEVRKAISEGQKLPVRTGSPTSRWLKKPVGDVSKNIPDIPPPPTWCIFFGVSGVLSFKLSAQCRGWVCRESDAEQRISSSHGSSVINFTEFKFFPERAAT